MITPTVWFQIDIFDPRALGRQVYVKSIKADEGVSLSRDANGVYVTVEHNGETYDHFVPNNNVRQALNVRERSTAPSQASPKNR